MTDQQTRRDFLRQMTAAPGRAGRRRAAAVRRREGRAPEPTADTCILLWMAGGMAAPETFDPKRYTPFEVGVPAEKILCTFPAIDTAVDNIKISQGLENVAKVHGPRHADPLARRRRPGQHPALAASVPLAHRLRAAADGGRPHIGSWIARVLGPRNPAIPPFINIGQRLEGVGEIEELKAFTTAGFFGSEYGPFNLPYPDEAVDAVRPPKGMTPRALRRRGRSSTSELLKAQPRRRAGQRLPPGIDAARRWTTPIACSARRSATPSTCRKEPKESYDKYNTGRFGLGCLLARRLDRGRGPLHRGDHRVRPVPALGHARERPHHAQARMKKRDRPADRPADPRPGAARPARPHAGRPGQRVQPRHDDRRHARQQRRATSRGPRPT